MISWPGQVRPKRGGARGRGAIWIFILAGPTRWEVFVFTPGKAAGTQKSGSEKVCRVRRGTCCAVFMLGSAVLNAEERISVDRGIRPFCNLKADVNQSTHASKRAYCRQKLGGAAHPRAAGGLEALGRSSLSAWAIIHAQRPGRPTTGILPIFLRAAGY